MKAGLCHAYDFKAQAVPVTEQVFKPILINIEVNGLGHLDYFPPWYFSPCLYFLSVKCSLTLRDIPDFSQHALPSGFPQGG